MIQVIPCDDHRVLDAILFPEQNPMNYHYIQQQLNSLSDNLNGAGRQFMMQQTQIYAQIDHNEIARKARQALRGVNNMYQMDAIRPLLTIEEIQQAPLVMHRWAMANEMARELRQQNRIDGFSDTYFDAEPGRKGENHTDWRRVMTGAVVETETGFIARQYYDEELGGELPPSPDQQRAIKKMWHVMEEGFKQGRDSTNIFDGVVGGI